MEKQELTNEINTETKHLVKTVRKYVIATMDNPTQYLVRRGMRMMSHSSLTGETKYNDQYFFVDDIERATKTMSQAIALDIINLYRIDEQDIDTTLVVLPVNITYELIEPM